MALLSKVLLPDTECSSDSNQLAEMIRVVINDQQQGSKIRLRPLAGRDLGEQVDLDVFSQPLQRFAIGLEALYARVPDRRVRRSRAARPVVVGPREGVHVPRVDAE